jgi:uncharacterized protein YhaN
MRIIRCHITAYGACRERRFADLDHPIVAFLGSNEAGKSTFAHFLKTMMYGFYPARQDTFPYMPREGSVPDGSLVYRTDGGEATIARRLMSSVRGDLHRGEQTTAIGNQDLPELSHVSMRVFESVYGLTLRDMAAVEGRAWQDVQDRLLRNLAHDHIRSPREVAVGLESAAAELWRGSNRGNALDRQLREQREALRRDLRACSDNDRQLRERRDELARCEAAIAELEAAQRDSNNAKRELDALVPAWGLLHRIDAARREAGDLSAFAGIPPGPADALRRMREEAEALHARIEAADAALRKAREEAAAFTPEDTAIVDGRADIRAWQGRAQVYAERIDNRAKIAGRRQTAAEKLERRVQRVLTSEIDDRHRDHLRTFPLADLAAEVIALEKSEAHVAELERQLLETGGVTGALQARNAFVLAAVLGGAAAVAAVAGIAWLVVAALIGAVAVVAYGLVLRGRAGGSEVAREALGAARQRREAARTAVRRIVQALPLPATALESPGRQLVSDIEQLKDDLGELDACAREFAEVEAAIAADGAAARETAARFGVPFADVAMTARDLDALLHQAEDRHRRAATAEKEIERLTEERARWQGDLDVRKQETGALEETLREIGDGDAAHGAAVLAQRRDARARALTLSGELAALAGEEDAVRQRIAVSGYNSLEEAAQARMEVEAEREATTAALRENEGERQRLRAEIAQMERAPSADLIEGELGSVEERLAEVRTRRDRIVLLANAIRLADDRFRRRHQPDVILRAGELLSRFTDGRYTGLALDDAADGKLMVYERGLDGAHPAAEPLSRGTLDQIYLALRLAIVDHLDEGHTRLPMFLDEVFVNWDRSRRAAGLDALAEMSRRRQVFVFTCHPWMAEEVAGAGGHVVELEDIAPGPEPTSILAI